MCAKERRTWILFQTIPDTQPSPFLASAVFKQIKPSSDNRNRELKVKMWKILYRRETFFVREGVKKIYLLLRQYVMQKNKGKLFTKIFCKSCFSILYLSRERKAIKGSSSDSWLRLSNLWQSGFYSAWDEKLFKYSWESAV